MLAGDLTLAIRGRSLDASHASVRLANLKIDLLIQFWRILRKWQVDAASVEGRFVCSVTEWAFLNWGKRDEAPSSGAGSRKGGKVVRVYRRKTFHFWSMDAEFAFDDRLRDG